MRRVLALGAAFVALGAGCGDDDDENGGAATAGERARVVVSAAASMTEALEACAADFGSRENADVRLGFAGSDELAAQIRQGVKPDVYAAANTRIPGELYDEGLVEQPVEFATNEFVLAVPKDSVIDSIEDLTADDVKIAIGSESVPIGSYTRETLAKLPPEQEKAILANVRSNEPDVKGIVGKLSQRAADAGFVYLTDVTAAGEQLRAIELPAELEPDVTYGAAVVKGAKRPEEGQAFVDGLTAGPCADALLAAGFGAAP
jgi:molybdate transport system substrate-binding protein